MWGDYQALGVQYMREAATDITSGRLLFLVSLRLKVIVEIGHPSERCGVYVAPPFGRPIWTSKREQQAQINR